MDVRLDNEEDHSMIFQGCLELFRSIYQRISHDISVFARPECFSVSPNKVNDIIRTRS
jgi:hypothetical protein